MPDKEPLSIDSIKTAVNEAIKANMRDFYIDRERHYKDHEFITSLRELCDSCKASTIKTICAWILKGALILIVLGLAYWVTHTK